MSSQALQEALSPAPLDTVVVGSRVLIFDSVCSTNDRALDLGGDGTVVVADCQTAGRGRHGKLWHSPPGLGLWFSVVFDVPVEGLPFLSALAVRDALKAACLLDRDRLKVKWPNDLLLDGGKICGMLVETRRGRSAVGIGINVHHRRSDFPMHLRQRVTSLEIAGCGGLRRGKLLRSILISLDRFVTESRNGEAESIWRDWIKACEIMGCRIACHGKEGIVSSIDATGALLLDTESGPYRVSFGEVTRIPIQEEKSQDTRSLRKKDT